jgi:hypothetical protein
MDKDVLLEMWDGTMSKYIMSIDPCTEQEKIPITNLERLPFPELLKEFAKYYEAVALVEEYKQETLEKAAENYVEMEYLMGVEKEYPKADFIAGAKSDAARDYWYSKWQQEHRQEVGHSVQVDVIDLIQFLSINQEFNGYGSVSKETAKYFLEQYKKSKQ